MSDSLPKKLPEDEDEPSDEVAEQVHILSRINREKYTALCRLYLGLQVLTVLTGGMVGLFEEYRRARNHVHEDQHFGFSANLWWSVFPGEENIMYAAHLASNKVVRLNVDTKQVTAVCSYDPGDGRDLSHVRVMGWTTDSKLIVTLGDNNGDVIPEKGGWEIDVKTTQRTYVPVARDDYSRWPAIGSHGHGTFSPDRSMYYRCGVNELRALPSQELIRTFATWQRDPPCSPGSSACSERAASQRTSWI